MVATVQVSVQSGAAAGSATDAVAGIDFISADNATNSLANRQANPISVGTNSYEKWVRLKVATPPSNYLVNFKIWGDGAVDTTTTLNFTSAFVTYQQGTTAVSTIANANFATYTAGNKATWDTTTYWATNTGSYTKYSVFQLQVGATANPGNWTQETISYQYDEA
jgi:hypothetical protein